MLRFINKVRVHVKDKVQFQYISCYGLSAMKLEELKAAIIFQYISCYGLSVPRSIDNVNAKIFQYISCYGLSLRVYPWNFCFMDFNTSHVTVYQPQQG